MDGAQEEGAVDGEGTGGGAQSAGEMMIPATGALWSIKMATRPLTKMTRTNLGHHMP